MDPKTALKILKLGKSASHQELKQAFKTLAKQHHPDHFIQESKQALKAEARMKQINLAFDVLSGKLPNKNRSKTRSYRQYPEPEKESTRPGGQILSRFFKIAKKWVQKNPSRPPEGSGRSGSKTGPESVRPLKKNQKPGGSGFEQIFCKACKTKRSFKNNLAGQGKEGCKTRPSPYKNYLHHMALKKRLESKAGRPGNLDPGPIEKIRPIQAIGHGKPNLP